jgi:MoaA/NifB/PqqE/SkfB family radical SAM enzyme
VHDGAKAKQILKHCFVKEKLPTKVVIMATDRCNSRCRTCNIWKQKPSDEPPLTPGEILMVLSDPVCQNIDHVLVTGGEPTLREDLYEFVLAIHQAIPSAHIALSTNGIRPGKMIDVVDKLLEHGVTNLSVGTSIDYIGEKHDDIRGIPGNWRRVNILIRYLMAMRKDYPSLGIGFGTVVQGDNADNIGEIVKFAKENDLFCLLQWCNQGDFYHNRQFKVLDPVKEREIVVKYMQDGLLKELWLRKLDGKTPTFNCFALKDFFVIKANGDVVPCLSMWDIVIGNVRATPVHEIVPRRIGCTHGCLNSWGTDWSFQADGWPFVWYFIKHPRRIVEKLR